MIKYGDGKAGRHGKGQAQKRIRQLLLRISVAATVGGFIAGLMLGYTVFVLLSTHFARLAHLPNVAISCTSIGLAIAACAAVWALVRALDGPVNKLSLERLKYLRGGETEALVAWQLQLLDDGWHLFNNVAMKGSGDIDHVLIGPGGLFAISTKGNRGVYTRDENNVFFLNAQPVKHVTDAKQRAMQLRHWLEARLQPMHDVKKIPFVQAVLALPFAYIDLPTDTSGVMICHEGELLDHVRQAGPCLNKAQIEGCVKILTELTMQDRRPSLNISCYSR